MKLSKEEATALMQIEEGADILSHGLAMTLREIKGKHPRYLSIVPIMHEYRVEERLPYFGALASRAGLKAAIKAGHIENTGAN